MRAPPTANARERGIALLEMTLALTVLSILTVVVGSVLDTGLGAYRSSSPTVVRQIAHRSVDRIADHISFAGHETLAIGPEGTPDGSALQFRPCLGSTAGSKTFGARSILEWRSDPEDPADGKDNDSDGAVDEGIVVLHQDFGEPGERTVVLARGVARYLEGEIPNGIDDNGNGEIDERGLFLQVEPRAVRIHLTLEKRGADGGMLTRTARALVAMRN